MTHLDARLDRLLDERKAKGRFRTLKEYDVGPGGLVDFSSNDYLSLTTSPTLRQTYLARLAASPSILGSTGSRLLSGCTPAHSSLERRLAAHFVAPTALLFNSGWDANVSFFATVPQPSDWVVYDELIHASVHSGMRASRVPPRQRVAFRHNDPGSLGEVLGRIRAVHGAGGRAQGGQRQGKGASSQPTIFLAVESLYSMDGDFAPLPALLDVLDAHVPRASQCVLVDEAHSTGVYGAGGRGFVAALGEVERSEMGGNKSPRDGHANAQAGVPDPRVTVRLMTFGKGVGCSGAVLLASDTVRSFLINFARPFIFSTAPPVGTVVALECAWDVLQGEEGERRRAALTTNILTLTTLLAPLLARTPRTLLRLPDPSPSPPLPLLAPIIGLLSPTPHALAAFLLERGYVVRPVVPPTVPPGGERVRICLRAGMGRDVLVGLVAALEDWVEREVGREVKEVKEVKEMKEGKEVKEGKEERAKL